MSRYRSKPREIDAMRWTGDNIAAIWEWGGAVGIYGPTEENPDTLLLTTIDGVKVPCPLGHFVVAEPVPNRFYPCDPEVLADRYEPVDADAAYETLPTSCICDNVPPIKHWSEHKAACPVFMAGGLSLDPVEKRAIVDVPLPGDGPCSKCEGCGKVANSDDQEPWTYWENLPLKTAMAVTLGLVQPVDCPLCGGSGKNIPAAEIVGDES